MKHGWSIKDAGHVLHIHPNKIPQATRPAFRKVAALMVADPIRTTIDLLAAMLDVKTVGGYFVPDGEQETRGETP